MLAANPGLNWCGWHFCRPEENKDTTSLLQYRIEHYNLDKIVRVLEIENQSVSLPDNPVDLALIIFTIHKDGTEWLIHEMARILKPSGKGVIIDSVLPLAEGMILDMIREPAPAHSQMSV